MAPGWKICTGLWRDRTSARGSSLFSERGSSMTTLQQQGAAAKAASYVLATAGTSKKNAALAAIAEILTVRQEEWLAANAIDVAAAREAGMRPADRKSVV